MKNLHRCRVALGALISCFVVIGFDGRALSAQNIPINERPMYGGIEKSAELKAADEALIAKVLESGTSREAAAIGFADMGFDSLLARKDPGKAMRQFNQAWLLDDDLGNAFHGFALVLVARGDLDGAEEMFERSVEAPVLTSEAYADYGKFLLAYRENPARAEPVLRGALERNPDNAVAKAHLAIALYTQNEFKEACSLALASYADIPFGPETGLLLRIIGSEHCGIVLKPVD